MDDLRKYVRKNKQRFIDCAFTGKNAIDPKMAIFMAGSPGSGKSESAKALAELTSDLVIIDADIYREMMPGYNPGKASDFQSAANLAVDIVFDAAVKGEYSFILDATFASSKSIENVRRAMKHKYSAILLVYVYQDPAVAWNFTKIREMYHDRNVPQKAFVNSCIESKKNYLQVLNDIEINQNVQFMLIKKDYNNNIDKVIVDRETIDRYINKMYNDVNLNDTIYD